MTKGKKEIRTYKIATEIKHYLYSLKLSNRNEVYETLLIMILNKKFQIALENLIRDNLNKSKYIKGKITSDIIISKEYKKAIEEVCKSAFFIKNYSKLEIEKRKIIASNIITELVTQAIIMKFSDYRGHINISSVNKRGKEFKDNNFVKIVNVNYENTKFPFIKHKLLKDEIGEKITLTFYKDEQLDDVTEYLKSILEIKNKPKRKTLSLGLNLRMLEIESDIKINKDKYFKYDKEYTVQMIKREMKKKYKDINLLTMEGVTKSLYRTKKIEREINMKSGQINH